VSAIETARTAERRTELQIPETTTRYLRLTVENLDDRPLTVTRVRLAAVRRGLVFRATPGVAYGLEYGNLAAAPPRYDLARTLSQLDGEPVLLGSLGPATALPPPTPPWTERQPLLIWLAMGVVALLLGALVLRLARQIRPGVTP
jgi:hypothetical protein